MLRTANGGIIENKDGLQIEILSHNFHNPHCNIVCTYFMEGNTKVELTYYKDITNNRDGHELYRFKTAEEVGHYYSKNYNNSVPKKYDELANKLKVIHSSIDFENYKSRN